MDTHEQHTYRIMAQDKIRNQKLILAKLHTFRV